LDWCSAADDPFAGLGMGDGAGDLGDDVVPGAGFAEVEAQAELSDSGEMAVASMSRGWRSCHGDR